MQAPARGIIFDVAVEKQGIVATRIANASSGYNWVAPNSGIGPSYAIGNTQAFFAVANPGEVKLVASEIGPGKQGADAVTARWVRKDGLALSWMISRATGNAVLEFQAQLKNTGAAPIQDIRSFGQLDMQLAARPQDLVVHYVDRQDYRKHTVPVPATITGGAWNAPASAGWIAIENTKAKEVLFIGVEWESYWTVRVAPHAGKGQTLVQCWLNTQACDLAPQSALVAPRVFLGLSHGDIDDSLRDLHDYLRRIMPPLPQDFPWVAYDIWATDATGVEAAILAEIPFAAKIGVDLFYVDASWYAGSCTNGSGDWFTGVGNYGQEDRAKFPGGLAAMSRKVHAAGMKFGLWFAPQVVDAALVGTVIAADFVARRDNQDISLQNADWAPITQICTGNPKVVERLKKVMGDAVEAYGLDWIKWDNSGLPGPVCNRTDHGHGSTDGALAALQGQYEIWRYLRERYPKLMLEECGYPSRLDYGLARTATSHWLSDSTASALGVRQGQIHASYVYPAAHNTAWILNGEGATDAALLDTIVRSRMMGLCGVGTLLGKLSERVSLFPPEVIAALARNFKVYKQYRHLLREDVYHLVPPSTTADAWDAIEFCNRDGREAAVLVFRSKCSEPGKVLALRGLEPDVVYEGKWVNSGTTRTMQGKELGAGVTLKLPAQDMSEILLLKLRSDLHTEPRL
ncbi:MAG: alpha-galactosidase [bacterium]|nr:alpha-galactosidase [bacterium]